ncbi:other/SCY1 protein kinase [Sparassis latifolia]|uniref:Protein kinase domain-containing protein n=1 Tax=Sparassis crispa TaxID=139825 RepID=A0A401GJQ3_9APHY|nr:Protein kinase domain-containing protein [Sparassis crispa]GBE82382.1 Protein kinase domain-containing protein [Sparassis crispa]
MFAAANSFFGRTNISQSYNIATSLSVNSRTSTPTPSGSSSTPLPVATAHAPPFHVGPWRVQSATHKVTHKRVSVWSADKRSQEMEKMGAVSKERTLEVLKSEASALSRLRHPSILEMVEPLEETRNELIFATEPVLSSLRLSIPGSSHYSPLVELDEVEIQKGILQICKGLAFLHTSARLIHSNLTPESIIINSSGDWKISGLGLTIPLTTSGGGPTRWEFPTFDGRSPPYTQRSFDYIAPEYALDEVLDTASDMYSIGCIMYAVHSKGNPPFKNHGSLGGLRENAGKPLAGMDRWDSDLRVVLNSLITRHAHNRPTPMTLPSHLFFSSLPISTLNFLDRSNFAAKSLEEKISFMKGLTGVLGKFSEALRTRKILPSLLEEMKDTHLLPYILPNIFAISQILTSSQFATLVLPNLKPLFTIKEPPQNMLTLLDNLEILQNKTEKPVFREHVLPLVYNALESEHAVVQERALKVVPDLCESIDYAEVQGVLFPRVALVFTKTRILTVKVATLVTFLAMVKTLDQTSLTQKLVPLLSKIRTKEPAVTMATLAVQEAMGLKVDREAVATLVLPQLWAMSMGPLLTISQFKRFMEVIRKLGDRVEKEHDQYLRDSQRVEDRSTLANGDTAVPNTNIAVDFENLVASGGVANGGVTTVKADTVIDPSKAWEDDVWGSIFSSGPETPAMESLAIPPLPPPPLQPQTQSLPSSPKVSNNGVHATPARPAFSRPYPGLGATPIPSTSFNHATFASSPTVSATAMSTPTRSTPTMSTPTTSAPGMSMTSMLTPSMSSFSRPSLSSATPHRSFPAATPTQAPAPNYNISLPPAPNLPIMSSPLVATPPQMGNVLVPSKPSQPSWSSVGTTKQLSQADWGDFDPLA